MTSALGRLCTAKRWMYNVMMAKDSPMPMPHSMYDTCSIVSAWPASSTAAIVPPDAAQTTAGTTGSSQMADMDSRDRVCRWNIAMGTPMHDANVSATSVHHIAHARSRAHWPNAGTAISAVAFTMWRSPSAACLGTGSVLDGAACAGRSRGTGCTAGC